MKQTSNKLRGTRTISEQTYTRETKSEQNELPFINVKENKAHSTPGLCEGAEVGSPAANTKLYILFVEMLKLFE